ncbi:autophagy-related protein 9A isoform X2 [Pseudophryne corroboree]|uniref:autophagy-related protein 9A isoform X2 n=1 Tax=Pseudophryne corroboree TaxID=495146 RepID=UPI003081406D
MAVFDTPYQRLEASYTDSPLGEDDLLVHVPEGSKSPWNHIENLDLFFSRVYNLHQKNGFTCMLIGETFELLQFIFVVSFTTFLVSCVDYDILFANKMVNHSQSENNKVTLPDAFLPPGVCRDRGYLATAPIGRPWQRTSGQMNGRPGPRNRTAARRGRLEARWADLPYYTWEEVQSRIVQIQKEHQICIHKKELSELDVSHRILRFKNYMVAMINKNLLPLQHRLPLLGNTVFYTRGLKYNFQLIFFWGPGCLFQNEWSLKPEYKRAGVRLELADKLSQRILWIGLANLVLCPLVLVWQILYAFFSYTEVLRREPGSLGARCWSLYGRCYLRHFNELDHQLQARLSRAYKPASKYMNCFLSPLLAVAAKHLGFLAGSILAVLIALTVYDEDVLAVEHVLSAVTLLGVVVTVCRSFIPDQHLVFCPEQLLRVILAHIHYMPDHWQRSAHRAETRGEFSQLFQYKAVFILEELLSPLLTPLVLIFRLRPKSLEIIDFFRNFTVEVVGVGDTCSFAQMDVRQHGNPAWMSAGKTEASVYQQAEDGKTELSLMHFAITNPRWQPPRECSAFLSHLRERVQRDSGGTTPKNPIRLANPLHFSGLSLQSDCEPHSLAVNMFSAMSPGGIPAHADVLCSPHVSAVSEVASALRSLSPQQACHMAPNQSGIEFRNSSFGSSLWDGPMTSGPLSEYASMEMSLHAVYIHELHQQHNRMAPGRHIWHRQESDESGESVQGDGLNNTTSNIPSSASCPSPAALLREDKMPPISAHRFSASTDFGSVQRAPSNLARQPMGGWSEDTQITRHPETVPEEGSEDELPPQTQKV